jgi:hypothetical protein
MRYRSERRPDGYWAYDTHKGELCFASRSYDQTVVDRWADAFNVAYEAFRDKAHLRSLRPTLAKLHPSSVPKPLPQQKAAACGSYTQLRRPEGEEIISPFRINRPSRFTTLRFLRNGKLRRHPVHHRANNDLLTAR